MRFRKLRIAFSIACLLACIVAVAILVRNRQSSQPVLVPSNSDTEVGFVGTLPSWDEIATAEIENYSEIGSEGLSGVPRAQLDERGWRKLQQSFRNAKPVPVPMPFAMIGLVRIVKQDNSKTVVELFRDGGVVFRITSGNDSAPRPYFHAIDSEAILKLLPTR
jgi:hypothetical protein